MVLQLNCRRDLPRRQPQAAAIATHLGIPTSRVSFDRDDVPRAVLVDGQCALHCSLTYADDLCLIATCVQPIGADAIVSNTPMRLFASLWPLIPPTALGALAGVGETRKLHMLRDIACLAEAIGKLTTSGLNRRTLALASDELLGNYRGERLMHVEDAVIYSRVTSLPTNSSVAGTVCFAVASFQPIGSITGGTYGVPIISSS